MNKVRERIMRNRFKEACFSNQIQVSEKFETDEDLRTMRFELLQRPDYLKLYKRGFQYYIEGKWEDARQYLEQVEAHKGMADYPSTLILINMEKQDYKAPSTWKGF